MRVNKKGQIGWMYENLGGLLLVLLIIGGLIGASVSIYKLIIQKPDTEGAINNFKSLTLAIDQLVGANKELTTPEGREITIVPGEGNKVQIIMPYYIPAGFGLVGFDEEEIEMQNGDKLKRPSMCLELPCICLEKSSLIQCSSIKNVKYMSIVPGNIINGGALHDKVGGEHIRYLNYDDKDATKSIKIIKQPSDESGKFNLLFSIE